MLNQRRLERAIASLSARVRNARLHVQEIRALCTELNALSTELRPLARYIARITVMAMPYIYWVWHMLN